MDNKMKISDLVKELNSITVNFEVYGTHTDFHEKVKELIIPVIEKYQKIHFQVWGIRYDNIKCISYNRDFQEYRASSGVNQRGIFTDLKFYINIDIGIRRNDKDVTYKKDMLFKDLKSFAMKKTKSHNIMLKRQHIKYYEQNLLQAKKDLKKLLKTSKEAL